MDYLKHHMHIHDIDGIAYIYFNYKQQISQTIIAVIACLIVQLLEKMAALEMPLYDLYVKYDNGKRKPSVEDLMGVLLELTLSKKLLLAFDALDESSAATRAALLSQLAMIKPKSCFILLTSRPGIEIKLLAQRTRTLDMIAHISDMEVFARAQLEANDDVLEILDDSATFLVPQIVKGVVAHAGGM